MKAFPKLIKIKNILMKVFKDLEKCYLQNLIKPSNKIEFKKVRKKGIYPIILIKKVNHNYRNIITTKLRIINLLII